MSEKLSCVQSISIGFASPISLHRQLVFVFGKSQELRISPIYLSPSPSLTRA